VRSGGIDEALSRLSDFIVKNPRIKWEAIRMRAALFHHRGKLQDSLADYTDYLKEFSFGHSHES